MGDDDDGHGDHGHASNRPGDHGPGDDGPDKSGQGHENIDTLLARTADDLGRSDDAEPEIQAGLGARQFDVFGTANFFNFKPWAAAIEHLLGLGIEAIERHDQRLVARLLDGLDRDVYERISPGPPDARSTLVFLSHRDASRNAKVHERLNAAKIHVAYRRGMLRFSPHIYNTDDDIDRALEVLDKV